MKELLKNNRSGNLSIVEVPPPQLIKGGVLVQNDFSAVSVGTELASVDIARKSLIEKARSRPEDLKKVMALARKEGWLTAYQRAIERLETPSMMGYSTSGVVIDVCDTVEKIKVGDRVACGGNKYAGHAEIVSVPNNLCVKVPENVDLKYAAFTTIGAIALQSVRQSNSKLGENVLVIGLGLVGQLVIQILKASGCIPIGIDLDQQKVDFAKKVGGIDAFTRDSDFIEEVERLTQGYGVDSTIITAATSSNDPIELALKLLRDRGNITVVGQIPMDIDWSKAYEKEISVNLSRSYGPGRYDKIYEEKSIDYPIGYVRWTENRNMHAFLELVSSGKLDIDSLITKIYAFKDSIKAYDDIRKSKDFLLGILFSYEKTSRLVDTIFYDNSPLDVKGKINIGFIGGGSYSKLHLFPNFMSSKSVNAVGICTMNGRNSDYLAKKYAFKYSTSDADKIINDDKINCVVISTRHDTHADLVVRSLTKNKHVFVEKPLAINRDQLDSIKEAYAKSRGSLMVGFNRRFSPFTMKALDFLKNNNSPIMINYRINAGSLPKDHWFYDREIGGGRISSETCHFIDFCNFIISSQPKRLLAEIGMNTVKSKPDEDTVCLTISYSNGSIANIFYVTNGSDLVPKEKVEIFGFGSTVIIDDFKSIKFFSEKPKKGMSSRRIDKGQRNQIYSYLENLLSSGKSSIEFEKIVQSTDMTLDVVDITKKRTIKKY